MKLNNVLVYHKVEKALQGAIYYHKVEQSLAQILTSVNSLYMAYQILQVGWRGTLSVLW